MDFGALPPEINSGRMYSGPGSGPMLAAATAWGGVAAELRSTATGYESVIAGLNGEVWSGPTAASMTAAVTPYLAWMNGAAAQAESAAAQARTAAAAFDTAFAATVPPPVIAANRSLLASLIATNILGQNAAAIAATEAHYAEMWAQDATAMYGYAAAAASAAQLTPFSVPPPTTDPAGFGAQDAAVAQAAAAAADPVQNALSQLIGMVPAALQGLAGSAPAATDPASALIELLNFLAGPLSPISLFGIGGIPYLLAIQLVMLPMNGANVVSALVRAGALPAVVAEVTPAVGAGATLVSSTGPMAGMANAASVGRLSVPQGWAAAVPEGAAAAKTTAAVLPGGAALAAADADSAMMSNLALGGLAGRALGVGGGAASRAATGKTSAAKAVKPTKATIIVIPPSADN